MIVSLVIAPDKSVGVRIAGVLLLIGLTSFDERSA